MSTGERAVPPKGADPMPGTAAMTDGTVGTAQIGGGMRTATTMLCEGRGDPVVPARMMAR